MMNNSLNSLTTYKFNGKQLNLKTLLALDIPELREAICRVTPILIEKQGEIRTLIEGIPNMYNHLNICSDNRKAFYKKGIELRVSELLEPAYLKVSQDISN